MFVHAPGQRQKDASIVSLELRPPIRADSIDLRALIRERGARFARAGHPAPLHVRRKAGEVGALASAEGSSGPAMGLIPNAQFNTSDAKLAPGDFLLFFTDGVIEVEDNGGRDFGVEGLQQSIRSNLKEPTESLLEAIISDVYKFAGSTVLTDDACLVIAEL
jgi:phosphoserine phosphatase RsbU/P